jgi:hypothetical protein
MIIAKKRLVMFFYGCWNFEVLFYPGQAAIAIPPIPVLAGSQGFLELNPFKGDQRAGAMSDFIILFLSRDHHPGRWRKSSSGEANKAVISLSSVCRQAGDRI